MKRHHLLLILILAASLVLPHALCAQIFEWEDKPEADHGMAFRLFVPEGLKTVRAVIALTPGLDGDGRGMATDLAWQALADRTQSALLACSMKGSSGGSYYEPEKWSGKIFLEALKKKIRHRKQAPRDCRRPHRPLGSLGRRAVQLQLRQLEARTHRRLRRQQGRVLR